MKIGFSFGRCVRDIVNGTVNIDDVLCVIARTCMPTEHDLKYVVGQYLNHRGYLRGLDPDKCYEVGIELFRTGRILEPRANGIGVMQVPSEYVWMDLFPTVADVPNESVKSAWDAYRMLIGLTAQLPEDGEDAVYNHTEKHVEHDLQVEKAQGLEDVTNAVPPVEPTDEQRKKLVLALQTIM